MSITYTSYFNNEFTRNHIAGLHSYSCSLEVWTCGQGLFIWSHLLICHGLNHKIYWSFPGGMVLRNLPANARDAGLIPGLGRSPGIGNGNPLQYSCLENSMDRGAWQAPVNEITKSQTWLIGWAHTHNYIYLKYWNACIPVGDSCQCMAKPIQYCKVISLPPK